MYRIDNSTAAGSIPTPAAAGTAGYFTDGSPGVTPATVVPADWLNMVQEELANVVANSGQTLSKTTYTQLQTALFGVPGKNAQRFTSSGSFTVPANVTKLMVEVIGGGGGGAGTTTTGSTTVSAGPGGNAGTRAYGLVTTTPGTVITVTVGSGGSGGTSGGGSGGAGSTSSFGAFISCPGGHGATGVGASPPPYGNAPTGATNVATGGTVTGAEIPGLPSIAGSITNAQGGCGASSVYGGGGTVTTGAGGNALAAGSGGAGGTTLASASGVAGGNGAVGHVLVIW